METNKLNDSILYIEKGGKNMNKVTEKYLEVLEYKNWDVELLPKLEVSINNSELPDFIIIDILDDLRDHENINLTIKDLARRKL